VGLINAAMSNKRRIRFLLCEFVTLMIRNPRANIAAEAGALNTYEQLIAITTDDGTRDALRHLATREVSHTHMFMEALRSLNALDQPLFGDLKPDNTVNLYFNLSSGPGADERGPWNREPAFQYVADPLQNVMQEHGGRTQGSNEMTPPGGMPARGPATDR
jgi:Mn-containing catalase